MKPNYMAFAGLGFELVGLVLGSMWVGSRVDEYFEWPGYAAAGLIVGMTGLWVVHLVLFLRRLDRHPPQPPHTPSQ